MRLYILEHQFKFSNYLPFFMFKNMQYVFKWYYCYACAKRKQIRIFVLSNHQDYTKQFYFITHIKILDFYVLQNNKSC